MKSYLVGQRWISETEAELGLGVVIEVASKTITVYFPAAKVDRCYGLNTAPLRRIEFEKGDEITTQDQTKFKVDSVTINNGIRIYRCGEVDISEALLSDHLSFKKPEERLMAGNVDSLPLFQLRYESILNKRNQLISPIRGFMGPRVSIIPHQFYVANEICRRTIPRVMLADEVGLGKTIEAGLIIHKLIQTERASRVLVLVPDSLVYQWFFELRRKFQLNFSTINSETEIDENENMFEENQLFIASLKFIMKSEQLKDDLLTTDWDLVVVDEAHQLRWSESEASVEYQFVEELSQKSKGLLLLSGTPEILGLQGHFARLKLLDPSRFYNFDKFLEESSGYQEVSDIAKILQSDGTLLPQHLEHLKKLGIDSKQDKQILIKNLIDRHGTGRIYFRNTRRQMASYSEFFPKRKLHPQPIEKSKGKDEDKLTFIKKITWLAGLLNEHQKDKTLLITHDKEMVLNIEKKLKDLTSAKVAIFHSGMGLVERDRQAAYFADPEGATILLSTEIGSEGRNFEFAKHLVLMDLPKLPDLLEQRIGRLDRIGQKNEIQIYVPYVLESDEEILFKWYHEGLNAFESSPRGATEVYAGLRAELHEFMELEKRDKKFNQEFNAFISKARIYTQEVEAKLDQGQDILIELNSFHLKDATELLNLINTEEKKSELDKYLFNLFNQLGVECDDLHENIWFIKPSDNMYMPHFPGLPNEGMMITFNRELALRREDVTFLTWDHPLVNGIIEFIESKEIGNATIATWSKANKEDFLIEAFFMLSSKAPREFEPHKYFPPTPLRILMNSKFQDMTAKYPKKMLDAELVSIRAEQREQIKAIPRDFFKQILGKAKEGVIGKAKTYKEKFILEMNQSFDAEINRLVELRKINPTVSQLEIDHLKMIKTTLNDSYQRAELNLDSIRLVI